MIYGYLRVSTDKQTLENQEFEIKTFCEREHISIDKWIILFDSEISSASKIIKFLTNSLELKK